MPLRSLAHALVLGVALGACAHVPPDPLPLTEIARGAFSQVKTAGQEVIRDQAGWDRVRSQLGVTQPAPPVDFSGQMLIAAFMGERRTGGYSIEIVSVAMGEDELLVKVREKAPAPGDMTPQALTAPFHIVRVPRTTQPVRFVVEGPR